MVVPLLAMSVVAVCTGGAASVDALVANRPPPISDAPNLTGTGTPEQQCVAAVSAMIELTPDSWGYGLRQGASDSLLVARYGSRSREVRAFRASQERLLAIFGAAGHRVTASQLQGVIRLIPYACQPA